MYKPKTYIVTWDDDRGEFHRGPIFETELEERAFVNSIWPYNDVIEVEIVKGNHKNKQRHPVTVASAHK